MDLKETEYEVVDWTHQAGDMLQRRALVDTIMHRRVSKKAGDFLAI
jgi:hypothetical protein